MAEGLPGGPPRHFFNHRGVRERTPVMFSVISVKEKHLIRFCIEDKNERNMLLGAADVGMTEGPELGETAQSGRASPEGQVRNRPHPRMEEAGSIPASPANR